MFFGSSLKHDENNSTHDNPKSNFSKFTFIMGAKIGKKIQYEQKKSKKT